MKRLLTPILTILGLAVVATPASAYCVSNETRAPLSVVLKDYSPLGQFSEVIMPGRKVCCDWFDRNCNPSGTREGMVTLSIREMDRRAARRARTMGIEDDGNEPIPTFDHFGRPDPNGRFDRHGNYDPNGHKPYYEPIETFNKWGRPDPDGKFDRYGVFDENGHKQRRGRLVMPKRAQATTGTASAKIPIEKYCARGRQPIVLATGAGTVSVVEDMLQTSGLRCESRDHFLRPVSPPSQAREFGVPIRDLPILKYAPGRRPQTTIQK